MSSVGYMTKHTRLNKTLRLLMIGIATAAVSILFSMGNPTLAWAAEDDGGNDAPLDSIVLEKEQGEAKIVEVLARAATELRKE